MWLEGEAQKAESEAGLGCAQNTASQHVPVQSEAPGEWGNGTTKVT